MSSLAKWSGIWIDIISMWYVTDLFCPQKSHETLVHPQGACVRWERTRERRPEAAVEAAWPCLNVYSAHNTDERRSKLSRWGGHHAAADVVRCGTMEQRVIAYFLMLSAGIAIVQNANEARPPDRKLAKGTLIWVTAGSERNVEGDTGHSPRTAFPCTMRSRA